jgi:hypothetical protein
MKQCKHEKVYSNTVLLTDPPQYQWICRLCGKEGINKGTSDNEYERLKKEKKDDHNRNTRL